MNEPRRERNAAPSWRVDTHVLRAALESELGSHFGQPCQILHLERRVSPYCSSFALEELVVDLDNGVRLELMFKDLSWQALSDEARHTKLDFLYNPRREIEAYRGILGIYQPDAPVCYGTVANDQAGYYWLFLEKVSGLELYQIGEFSTWLEVARALARMHSRSAAPTALLQAAPSLLRYNRDFYLTWIQRLAIELGNTTKASPSPVRHSIEWLAERYRLVIPRLLALPLTLIHGEFYPPNVLVQKRDEHAAASLRVCPVDWEMAAIGPGLMDMAALVAGKWTDAERSSLALAYFESSSGDNTPATIDEFLAALDCCRLHQAIMWLSYFGRRRPYAGYVHDWLGEALGVAEKLEA